MSSNRGRKPAVGGDLLPTEAAKRDNPQAGGDPINIKLPPPSFLGRYGKGEWRRVLPKLVGVATNLDYAALMARYTCSSSSRI